MADRECLRPKRRQRRGGIGSILFGRQHVVARCAALLVARGGLLGALFTEQDQLLGRSRLFLQRGRFDRRDDDVGCERTARRRELEGLLLDLLAKRPISEHGRSEKIKRIGGLYLCGVDALEEGFLRKCWKAKCALTGRTERNIDARQHR